MTKRKDALRQMMIPISVEGKADEDERRPVKSRALKSMGLSLEGLSAQAGEADRLRDQLARGEAVVEIDSGLVDPSFVRDRLGSGADPSLEELTKSIADHGQQVPILVRPHPDKRGRYQVAYGHRRLAAARELKLPVRAIVRPLSDVELVVAQGKENLERRDLSFIERALFAARLEDRGFDRGALTASLAVHKGNLSTMIAVARSVPVDLIESIGPAPKAGRPRWEQLSQALGVKGALQRAKEIVDSKEFQAADSDSRFGLLLGGLRPQRPISGLKAVEGQDGKVLARVSLSDRRVRLTIDEAEAPAFGSYLIDRLPEIYAEFSAAKMSKRTPAIKQEI